jgi:hypothetical protein
VASDSATAPVKPPQTALDAVPASP